MTDRSEYRFADLNAQDRLLDKITHLESEIARELGEPVTLIAYTPRRADSEETGCRSGLAD